MSRTKVSLPDQIQSDIDRLVEQGEFINQDQAIEDLLTRGISAYNTTEESTDDLEGDFFNETANEQQDPAMQEDDYL